MRNQRLLVILFIILLVFAVLLYFSNKDSTLKSRLRNFSIENVEQIDKILIAKGGDRVLLKKEKDSWKINNTLTGNPSTINFLLSSISRLEVKSPVTNINRDRILYMLNEDSKNIDIYSRGRLLKSISLYHDTSGIAGTYMMLKNSSSPFLVKIKGYQDINIDRIFSLRKEIWCDNTILDYNPDEIKNLIIEYPQKPETSFQIINQGNGKYYLKYPDDERVLNNINVEAVAEYLYSFSNIKFRFSYEQHINNLKEENPFAIITIIKTDNMSMILEGYRKYTLDTILRDSIQGYYAYDPDYFYALANNMSELIELYYIDFDPIFKDVDYFLKK